MKKIFISLVVSMSVVFAVSLCFASDDFDPDMVSDMGSTEEGMEIHGYYEFEWWDKENARGTFDAHKITIWMGKTISDEVYVSGEFEYEHFPRLEGAEIDTDEDDDGTITSVEADNRAGGNGEIKLDAASASYTPKALGGDTRLFCGVFYVPFGIEYDSYPGHMNKLITRPDPMRKIIRGTWSDVGIGFEQKVPSVGSLSVYTVNGDAKNGGISRDSSGGGNAYQSIGAKLSISDAVEGLNIGGSYVTGNYDGRTAATATAEAIDANNSSRFGAHLRIDGKDLYNCPAESTIIAEYVGGTDELASAVSGKDKTLSGYYAQLSFRPLATLDVGSNLDTLEVAVRYESYDTDEEVDNNVQTNTSFGISYAIHEEFDLNGKLAKGAKLKVEYQMREDEKDNGSDKVDDDVVVVGVAVNW